MHKHKLFLSLLIISLLAFAGCDYFLPKKRPASPKKTAEAGPPPGETVVAKVGAFYITESDLNKEVEAYNGLVDRQGMAADAKIDTRAKKLDYLKGEMVRRYLLYQEALDRSLDKQEAIARMLEQTKINLLVNEVVNKELEGVSVSSKEVEDFYSQNKELLKEPEQRKISEIVSSTEEAAKQIYIEILKGSSFSELAKQSSKGKTASAGGDIGFITDEQDPKKRVKFDNFYKVAFSPSLTAGSISNIFSGTDGYYIIKIDSIKKSEAKSLNELWDDIKKLLLGAKQQKALEDVINKAAGQTKVEIYESKVE